MELLSFIIGAAIAALSVWLGWRLGYATAHETLPPPVGGESFDGTILDFSVYPDETADE